ncbi:MAG: hydrogenase maturation protease [Candidatus Humimicrobiaceae bacterium]
MNDKKQNLIVGFGNILLTDDGIGIHIVNKLKEEESLKGNQFLDLGTSSMDIGYYLNNDIARMVIIDCIKSDDDEPGTLFKMGLDDLVSKKKENFSLHQLKLIDTIKLVSIENTFPETMILGIVPKDTKTFSDKLSKELTGRLTFIYDKILELIKDFLE